MGQARRRGDSGTEQFVHAAGERLGTGAQLGSKGDFQTPARFAVEKGAPRDRDAQHFFKAKRLRAQLYLVAIVRLALAALVLNRIRLGPELHNVSPAGKRQTSGAEPHASHGADRLTPGLPGQVGALVQQAPLGGEPVLPPLLLNMD